MVLAQEVLPEAQKSLPEAQEKVLREPAELVPGSSLGLHDQHQLGWRVPAALSP